MTTFTINADNTIIAFASPNNAKKSIGEGAQPFSSQAQLEKLTAEWTMPRLVEAWNGMAGAVPFDDLRPVRTFENRAKAVARIWQALQRLVPVAKQGAQDARPEAPATEGASRKTKAKGAARGVKLAAKEPDRKAASKGTAREGSKSSIIMGMIAKGATLADLMAAATWEAHSIRGFLSTAAKKQGITIESTRNMAGERFYKIAE